jgi:hypothetical protein
VNGQARRSGGRAATGRADLSCTGDLDRSASGAIHQCVATPVFLRMPFADAFAHSRPRLCGRMRVQVLRSVRRRSCLRTRQRRSSSPPRSSPVRLRPCHEGTEEVQERSTACSGLGSRSSWWCPGPRAWARCPRPARPVLTLPRPCAQPLRSSAADTAAPPSTPLTRTPRPPGPHPRVPSLRRRHGERRRQRDQVGRQGLHGVLQPVSPWGLGPA